MKPRLSNPKWISLSQIADQLDKKYGYTIPEFELVAIFTYLVESDILSDIAIPSNKPNSGIEDAKFHPMCVGIAADFWYKTANIMLRVGDYGDAVMKAMDIVVDDLRLLQGNNHQWDLWKEDDRLVPDLTPSSTNFTLN